MTKFEKEQAFVDAQIQTAVDEIAILLRSGDHTVADERSLKLEASFTQPGLNRVLDSTENGRLVRMNIELLLSCI